MVVVLCPAASCTLPATYPFNPQVGKIVCSFTAYMPGCLPPRIFGHLLLTCLGCPLSLGQGSGTRGFQRGLETSIWSLALLWFLGWRDKQNPQQGASRYDNSLWGRENITHVSKDPAFAAMKNGISRFVHHTSMRKNAQLIHIQLRDIWI